MSKTKIQWTEETWNPVVGCTKVSEGCRNCYAIKMAYRLCHMGSERYEGLTKKTPAGIEWTNEVRIVPEALKLPLRRKKPTMFFVNSMSDLFHEKVPFEFITEVFEVMAHCPEHTFQVLTKRPERAKLFYDTCKPVRLPNVWVGVSVEDQESANKRIPVLLETPAAVRWLSVEPMLEKINLHQWLCEHGNSAHPEQKYCGICSPSGLLDWVVCGGESGAGARPMDLGWMISLMDQCEDAGVPFFMKQAGTYLAKTLGMRNKKGGDVSEWNEWMRVREYPKTKNKSEEKYGSYDDASFKYEIKDYRIVEIRGQEILSGSSEAPLSVVKKMAYVGVYDQVADAIEHKYRTVGNHTVHTISFSIIVRDKVIEEGDGK